MTSVIIPYRDRAEHLAILAPRLAQVLPDAEILVIEQVDGKPFNRGKLLNIGAINAKGQWLVMHDVDKVPIKVSYIAKTYAMILQLCSSEIQKIGYLGGVTMFETTVFKQYLDGYSNYFWGWGGEDNEMMNHINRKNFSVENMFGQWEDLPHPANGTFDWGKWHQAHNLRADDDGLSNCRYEETARTRHHYYTKITVEI